MEKIKVDPKTGQVQNQSKGQFEEFPLDIRIEEAKGQLKYAIETIKFQFGFTDDIMELVMDSVKLEYDRQSRLYMSSEYMSIIQGLVEGVKQREAQSKQNDDNEKDESISE